MANQLSYPASLVRQHDHDRFLCSLFAPSEKREGLFALYAVNSEIARTREIVSEPMLGLIRLQWWREAIDSVYSDTPREHEVVKALHTLVQHTALSREYFVNSVKNFNDDTFIVFQNGEYAGCETRWPICYCAAKGSTFREIFQTYSLKKIRELIIEWANLKLNWDTDELMLFKYVSSWKKYKTHCILLNHTAYPHRIDRFKPETFKLELVPTGHYWDMHWFRPWNEHKEDIIKVLELLPNPLKFKDKNEIISSN